MEQIIDQLKTPETVDFGGVVWVKRTDRDETYSTDLSNGEYVYVSQYDEGGWNWQRQFKFERRISSQLFFDRASGIVSTRDEAMMAALTADKSAYIAGLVDALAAAGFINADSNYKCGFRDGQAALKAAISGIECSIGGAE